MELENIAFIRTIFKLKLVKCLFLLRDFSRDPDFFYFWKFIKYWLNELFLNMFNVHFTARFTFIKKIDRVIFFIIIYNSQFLILRVKGFRILKIMIVIVKLLTEFKINSKFVFNID